MRPAGVLANPVRLTHDDYAVAMDAIMAGMGQLEPDGKPCAICGDSGHQAWECHHNPVAVMKEAAKLQTYYRCYHCGFVATADAEAMEHFGEMDTERPLCAEIEKACVDYVRMSIAEDYLRTSVASPEKLTPALFDSFRHEASVLASERDDLLARIIEMMRIVECRRCGAAIQPPNDGSLLRVVSCPQCGGVTEYALPGE